MAMMSLSRGSLVQTERKRHLSCLNFDKHCKLVTSEEAIVHLKVSSWDKYWDIKFSCRFQSTQMDRNWRHWVGEVHSIVNPSSVAEVPWRDSLVRRHSLAIISQFSLLKGRLVDKVSKLLLNITRDFRRIVFSNKKSKVPSAGNLNWRCRRQVQFLIILSPSL